MKTTDFILIEDYATEVKVTHNADGSADVESKGQLYHKGDIITAYKMSNESIFVKDDNGGSIPIPRDIVDYAHPEEVSNNKKIIPTTKKTKAVKSQPRTTGSSVDGKKIVIRLAVGIGIYIVLTILYKSIAARQ